MFRGGGQLTIDEEQIDEEQTLQHESPIRENEFTFCERGCLKVIANGLRDTPFGVLLPCFALCRRDPGGAPGGTAGSQGTGRGVPGNGAIPRDRACGSGNRRWSSGTERVPPCLIKTCARQSEPIRHEICAIL